MRVEILETHQVNLKLRVRNTVFQLYCEIRIVMIEFKV